MKTALIKRLALIIGLFCFLGDCWAMAEDNVIYHVVTTVSENPANAVTVNYHCSNKDSYVLYTKARDVAFRKAVKVEPASVLWSTDGIEKTAKETTFYTRERFVCNALITSL